MIRRCFFCRAPFPPGQVLEHLPTGDRIAWDSDRGRLWLICTGCGRWNLMPLDARWEALEELERQARDRARVLTRTDNIGLLTVDGLQLVQVGSAPVREEAWWRYGGTLLSRQAAARRIRRWGKVKDALMASFFIGLPIWGWRDQEVYVRRARERQFGRNAWRRPLQCTRCGFVRRELPYRDMHATRLTMRPDGPELWNACPRCGRAADDAGMMLDGAAASHVLRAALAWGNFQGATQQQVERAAEHIDQAGSADALVAHASGRYLGDLSRTEGLALEISFSTERERDLLQMEARELEARWREEEEVAAIADRL